MYRICMAFALTVCIQAPAVASDWVEDGDAPGGQGVQGQGMQQPVQAPMQNPAMQGQPVMPGSPSMMQQGLPGRVWKKPKKSWWKRLSGDDDDDDDTIFGGMGFPATGGLRTQQTYSMPFASGTVTTEEEGFGAPMFAGTEVPVPAYSFNGGMPMVGTQYMGVPGMPGQVLGAPGVMPYGGVYGGGLYPGVAGYGGGYSPYGYGGYGYGGSPLGYAVGGLLNRFAGPRNVYGYGNGGFVGPGGLYNGGMAYPGQPGTITFPSSKIPGWSH